MKKLSDYNIFLARVKAEGCVNNLYLEHRISSARHKYLMDAVTTFYKKIYRLKYARN